MNSSIKKLVFDEKTPSGFEILSLDGTDARLKENLNAPHRAAFYLIFWFKKGTPVHTVDFNLVNVKPDSFLFIRKDAVQFFDQTRDFISRVILFTEDFFCSNNYDRRILQTSSLLLDFQGSHDYINVASNSVMRGVWAMMEHEADQGRDSLQAALFQKYLSSFILLAERERQKSGHHPVPSGPHADLAIAFKGQLEKDFKQKQAVNYYTGKLFVSNKVLTHSLQLITGKRPKQLIDERVMLEAKRLLIHENGSAKMIAFSLGFEEPTNFNKFFKKHSGKTPTEFRMFYLENRMGAKVSS